MKMNGDIPPFLEPGNHYHASEYSGWVYFGNSTNKELADVEEENKTSWPGHVQRIESFEPDGPDGPIHFALYYKP